MELRWILFHLCILLFQEGKDLCVFLHGGFFMSPSARVKILRAREKKYEKVCQRKNF